MSFDANKCDNVSYVDNISGTKYVLTLPSTQYGDKLTDRLGRTQNIPTHKSAAARFARKKLVTVLIFLCRKTTNITSVLPETKKTKISIQKTNNFIVLKTIFPNMSHLGMLKLELWICRHRNLGWGISFFSPKNVSLYVVDIGVSIYKTEPNARVSLILTTKEVTSTLIV